MIQKISHRLADRPIGLPGIPIGRLLDFPLPVHAAQHIFPGKILRMEGHKQCRVGIFPAPPGIAHAVGAYAARFRGCRKHIAAGAHAECIGTGAVGQMTAQIIAHRRQVLSPGSSVLGHIQIRLTMLDANAHGKGFPHHGNPRPPEPFKGIPGAVADGQNHVPGGNHFRPVDFYTGHGAVFLPQSRQLCAEPYFTAAGNHGFPNLPHHPHQNIRSDMGFCVIANLRRGAVTGKLVQNPPIAEIVGIGVQLAVGKGSRAALAELHIVFRVQRTAGAEQIHRFLPGIHIAAPLQNNGSCPGIGQHQGRKHARRAESHNHRALRQRRLGNFIGIGLLHRGIAVPGGNFRLITRHGEMHCIDVMNVPFFSGVQGFFCDFKGQNFFRLQPQRLFRQLSELFLRFPRPQGQFL